MNREEDLYGLAGVHAALVECLQEVDRICRAHGLRYILYCGTLLGAVRDGGLIPWDDDIDLAMPYGDYRKFYCYAQKELAPGFTLQDQKDTPDHTWLWMRLYRDGTTFMRTSYAGVGIHKGVALDIYPFIGVCPGKRAFRLQKAALEAAQALRSIRVWDHVGYVLPGKRERAAQKAMRCIPPVLRRGLSLLLQRLAMREPDRYKTVCTLDAAPFEPKFLWEDWREVMPWPLYGREYLIPARYDKLLTMMYGDYKTPPPPRMRRAHVTVEDSIIVDTERDYSLYEKELLDRKARARRKWRGERDRTDDVFMQRCRSVNRASGKLRDELDVSTNLEPVFAPAGSSLIPLEPGLRYRLALYDPEVSAGWLHTYAYQRESNLTEFRKDQDCQTARSGEYRFERDCYFRLTALGRPAAERLWDLVRLETPKGWTRPVPAWIGEEARAVLERVDALRRPGDMVLTLLADSHYCAGGNWPDTLESLRAVVPASGSDAVVHLGDLTDGLLPGRVTRLYASRVIEGLKGLGKPLYMCLGNHDANYFKRNAEYMTPRQCARFYLGRERGWYHVDAPDRSIRMIFLDSFDLARRQRYGFSAREALWFRRALRETPAGWGILVFSHVPPLARVHVWSKTILRGDWMLRALREAASRKGRRAIAWVFGHNHSDQVVFEDGLPVVSVGCSKTEDFQESKAPGSVTPRRAYGGREQELWDTLLVHADGSLDFVRYGAGEDRHIGAKEAGRA